MKNSFEDQIDKSIEYWDCNRLIALLKDCIPLLELYNVDEEEDWVKDAVGEFDERNVRLIRTVYLISKLAENHSGALVGFRVKFPKLWEKIEKHGTSS